MVYHRVWQAGRGAARMASASRGGGVPRYKDGGAAARLLVGQVLHQRLGDGGKVGVRCWPAVRGGRSGGSGIVVVLMVCLWLRGQQGMLPWRGRRPSCR
jgi:hypothetical protein